jgi:hypothetical protein
MVRWEKEKKEGLHVVACSCSWQKNWRKGLYWIGSTVAAFYTFPPSSAVLKLKVGLPFKGSEKD